MGWGCRCSAVLGWGVVGLGLAAAGLGCAGARVHRPVEPPTGESAPLELPRHRPPAPEAEVPLSAAAVAEGLAQREAARLGIQEELLLAVIWTESRFDPNVTSPVGAAGLMQLMPATAAGLGQRLGVQDPDPYDPAFNVRAGAFYLRGLLDRFGEERLALAAYATGPGRVARALAKGKAPPAAALRYADKVLAARDALLRGDAPSQRERPPAGLAPGPELDGQAIEELIRASEGIE